MMLNVSVKLFCASMIAGAFSFSPHEAKARCETAPVNGPGRTDCGGTSSRSSRSSNNDAGTAAIGIGIGAIVGGLIDAANAPKSSEEIDREIEREHQEYLKAPPSAKTKAALRSAEADKSLDPWAKKSTGTAGDPNKAADGRAPMAQGACAELKPGGSGITADNVRVTNKCAFPIQVLHCFYKPGETSKCKPNSASGWGVTSTIAPGQSTISIAASAKWQVSYYVCNMSGVKNYSKLCLRPK